MRPAVFAALAVVVVACSSSDASGTVARGPEGFAKAYCELVGGTCCPKGGRTYLENQCLAIEQGVVAQGTFDQTTADACTAGLRGAQSPATYCTEFGLRPGRDHRRRVVGRELDR